MVIGSLNPQSGFFLEVQLNSAGAAIESVQLSDPAFKELTDEQKQLAVVGTNSTDDRTFSTAITTIDEQLKSHGLKLAVALLSLDGEILSSIPENIEERDVWQKFLFMMFFLDTAVKPRYDEAFYPLKST